MKLYVLRHGIAAPLNSDNDFADAKRALTPDGALKMRKASEGLRKLDVSFDLIASSPLVRAQETAQIVVEVLRHAQAIEEWPELLPSSPVKAVLQRLRHRQSLESVLIVGHQPHLGSVISTLVFGDDSISLPLKKGGLCCIRISPLPDPSGELLWMLPPKILRRLAAK